MNIAYKNTISADEVNFLRASAGFRQILPEQINSGLSGSAFIVAAYDNEQIIGMSRLIWDGGIVALIPNILVLPEYQDQGVEAEMITQIIDFLKSKLKPGFSIQLDLKAWNGQESLCENLGFQISTKELRGTPMHICLTDHIELTDAKFRQCEFALKNK